MRGTKGWSFQLSRSGPAAVALLFALVAVSAWPAFPGPVSERDDIPPHPNQLTFPPLDFTPPKAADHRHVLSNGSVVYVVEDATLPLVDVSVLVRTGSYLEPQGKEGLSVLAGSQIREGGTKRLKAADFDEEVDFLAAQIASSIGDTSGSARLNCLAKDLDAALELFFEMLRSPGFQQDRLDLAKNRALQAMQRRNDSTDSIEGREWERLQRGSDHFTTRLPTRVSMEGITREDLIEFHRSYYHPGGFLFAVSGDVKTEDVLARLEKHLEGWESKTEEPPPVPRPEHTPRAGLYLIHKADVNQGRVSIGHPGIQRDNPDHYAIAVMNDILGGGGFTSRLLTRVRSDEGLAYSAGSSFTPAIHYPGIFRTGFQSRSETVARATAIALEEIRRIRTEHVSDEELQTSLTSFVETFSRRFASAQATANLLATEEFTGRDPGYWETYRDRIRAISAEDVLRVAQTYLHPDDLVILMVGNVEDILKGDPDHPEYSLEKLAPKGVIERIPLPDPMTLEYPPAG